MLDQYHRIKRENRDAILMFRMGDFYEMFYDDARLASEVLEIALTARGRGTDNEAPMCGVPRQAVDSYIARLIASGHRVAVCDQVEEAGQVKGLVRREVVRVVSPGPVTDPAALDARDNLYIACLLPAAPGVGAAWIDLSTGDFRVSESCGARAWEEISLQMAAVRPREILHPDGADVAGRLDPEVAGGAAFGVLESWVFGRDAARRALTDQLGTRGLEGFGIDGMDLASRAGGALVHHLRRTQRSALEHIQRVVPHAASDHMMLDAPTLRTLEVVRTFGGEDRRGSLLSVMDRTVTPMGARRLRSWLLAPLLSPARVGERLDAVGELVRRARERDQARGLLAGIRDLERLLGRVTLGAATARDLAVLRASLAPLPRIAETAARLESPLLRGRPGPLASTDTAGPPEPLDALEDLHDLLARAIEDDPSPGLHEGGLIRAGWSAELDDLRSVSRDGASYLAALEARERRRSGIASLKVRYHRVFGYSIEVSKPNLPLVPADYERRQTLVNAERFVTPELKEYEEKILTARERSGRLEYDLFLRVRDEVAARAGRIKAAAGRIAELDALAGLADLAAARGYSRPVVTQGCGLEIRGGRHPVVEALQADERFVPNDVAVGGAGARILIVTGPNMGGKSTFLRQTALIVLMAQAGSFVPAESASIGLVDRIFSRIGASDNLAAGQSTFMVEMQETANILNNATGRSLILLDEVGRGTSTFDGLSVAWAIVEHLHHAPAAPGQGARVLFATHFHELTELALTLSSVRNLTVAVRESGQELVFLRRIVEGAADRSYGIHVARLAGVPLSVLERAREILHNLERNELGRDGMPKLARHGAPGPPGSQLPLFGGVEDPAAAEVAGAIRRLRPEEMTPLQALDLLHRLKERLEPPS